MATKQMTTEEEILKQLRSLAEELKLTDRRTGIQILCALQDAADRRSSWRFAPDPDRPQTRNFVFRDRRLGRSLRIMPDPTGVEAAGMSASAAWGERARHG